jgi:AcrR family transcriptional regulator
MYEGCAMASGLTKVEQTQRTRRAILDRARLLFAKHGYAATGTEELIRGLGITRGALYHQFKDKQGVLEAVIGEVYEEITGAIRARVEPLESSWERIVMGCHACLDIAMQEDLRRLVFIEAPAFLSVDTLASLDKPGFTLLQEAIQNAVDQGLLKTVDVEGFTFLLNGSLNALASWAALSSDCDRLRIAHDLLETQIQLYRA